MSKQDVYIAKMKLQLDELNLELKTLEAKARDARADAKDKVEEEMAKLRHQSKLAGAKLDEMKASAENTWDKTVAEMEKLRDAFKHSFAYFKSQV
ncbi:MAG: hypothetical protein KA141_10645 [Rubrivivax sp.]|jgi:hypothetical protein|nr:hypothetical protein [Rubrivivax sp.]